MKKQKILTCENSFKTRGKNEELFILGKIRIKTVIDKRNSKNKEMLLTINLFQVDY